MAPAGNEKPDRDITSIHHLRVIVNRGRENHVAFASWFFLFFGLL